MPQSPHRLRNDLKCVEWDVKPYTTTTNWCVKTKVRLNSVVILSLICHPYIIHYIGYYHTENTWTSIFHIHSVFIVKWSNHLKVCCFVQGSFHVSSAYSTNETGMNRGSVRWSNRGKADVGRNLLRGICRAKPAARGQKLTNRNIFPALKSRIWNVTDVT